MPLPTRHGGPTLFAQYAFPPNELGYCGPPGTGAPAGLAGRVRDFDGAWPYLAALASAAGHADLLDDEVVHDYWIGGPLLAAVDPADLLTRLRLAFTGQATGLLDAVSARNTQAHHSFHVFVVYPWIRFLDRDPVTPLRVLQSCRIRWGTVESVDDDHVAMRTCPLVLADRVLTLGAPVAERVRWRRDGASLIARPMPGDRVAAHWDWVCGALTDDDVDALAAATRATLDLVGEVRATMGAAAPVREEST